MTDEEKAFVEKVARRAAEFYQQDPNAYVILGEAPVIVAGGTRAYLVDQTKIKRLWVLYAPMAHAVIEEMHGRMTV